MAAFCLTPEYTAKFRKALEDGDIDPARLIIMSSADRSAFLSNIVGKENAFDVNALFESKLLLKNQQAGLVNWAKKVAGLTDAARKDIVAKIGKLDRVLQPADEQSFLADLAEKKLGVSVSADEAKQIFDLSQVAEQRRAEMNANPSDVNGRIAYGRSIMDLTDTVESMKPDHQTVWNRVVDILNVPKSALTSILHFSAPFVQGWGMMSTGRAWEAFSQMFRYFADENNFKDLQAYIITHPDYHFAQEGRLGLTKLGDKLSSREEAIQSTLVEKANEYLSRATGVPNLVRASSRSFTGFLNYVRFNRFVDLLNAARLRGEDVSTGSSVIHDLAKVVNDFTGRGAIGPKDAYAQATPALNAMFFSPRKISATVQMFNPMNYLDPRISPTARIAAVRQLSGSLLATGSVLAIAKAMGASIDMDPRSADFAKIEIGGEKLDITGGNAVYLRLLGRLATGQEITAGGKQIDLGVGYKPTTRAELITSYLRNKLSPVAGFVADSLYGTDPAGRPFDLTNEVRDKITPIIIGDVINFAQNDAHNTVAILPALSAIFGVGLESPMAPEARQGMNVWGQPSGHFSAALNSPIDQELHNLGYRMNFPSQDIQKVPLTDEQYSTYIETSGRLAYMGIEDAMNMDGWSDYPTEVKLRLIRQEVTRARKMAGDQIMLDDLSTAPEGESIMDRATALKHQSQGIPAEP